VAVAAKAFTQTPQSANEQVRVAVTTKALSQTLQDATPYNAGGPLEVGVLAQVQTLFDAYVQERLAVEVAAVAQALKEVTLFGGLTTPTVVVQMGGDDLPPGARKRKSKKSRATFKAEDVALLAASMRGVETRARAQEDSDIIALLFQFDED